MLVEPRNVRFLIPIKQLNKVGWAIVNPSFKIKTTEETKKMKKITKKDLNQNIYISEGNKKLKRNDNSYFLIWSLPSVVTCPYATSLCKKSCYAKKAERQYKQVLPCRERNLQESRKSSFVADMVQSITYYTNLPKNKDKQCFFRIHESGDFYNLPYLIKWMQIAEQLPDVTFTAYTKSVSFVNAVRSHIPKNLVIRYSIWDDTREKDVQLAQKLNLPIFTAKDKGELESLKEYSICPNDCSRCKKCYSNKYKRIAIAIH